MASDPQWKSGDHPTPEQLLLAREHELPKDEAEPILGHLHQCWQCRAEVERQKRGIETYLRFRETRLNPAVSPKSGGWMRMAARLRHHELSEPAPGTSRLHLPRRAWIAVPVAIAAAIVGAILLAPSHLTADVVLSRAEAVAGRGLPAPLVMVHRGQHLVPADDLILRQAHIDPSHPLSVHSFRTWRNSLKSRKDSVETTGREIRVETSTKEGAVALASLTVAQQDYQPRSKHVELRDGAVIDVEAVATPAAPDAVNPAPATAAGESPTLKHPLSAQELEAVEMDVRWELHKIDADLGEPLQIRASEDGIIVTGAVDDSARRDQITAALHALPHVSTRIALPAADANLLARAQPLNTSASTVSPLLASARDQFVSQALHLSRDLLRQSWALRRLADRFPPAIEAALPPETRNRLDSLVAAHARERIAAEQEAALLWKPYAELDASGSPAVAWQASAQSALQAAESFDHFTARLLTAGGDDGLSAADALRQLRQAFEAFPAKETR